MKPWLLAFFSVALLAGCRSASPLVGPSSLQQPGGAGAGLIGLDAATMQGAATVKGSGAFGASSAAKKEATASAPCESETSNASDSQVETVDCL